MQYEFTVYQKIYLKIKRVLDFLFSLLLLFVLSPLFLITAICVKLESKGPIIYKQKRPGKNKKIFNIYKFRSMKIELVENDKPLLDNDRITLVGKFIRKWSIDELPQLLNVLKGEMSLIGPRPNLINDLATYSEKQLIRFAVLPGMTSWAALHGRNNTDIVTKYDYEIYYVENLGLKIDLIIFFKTIFVVLSGKNVEDKTNFVIPASDIIEKEEI